MQESASVRLTAGAGTAKIGPLSARERWYPQNVAVSANNSPANEAQCVISVGDVNSRRQRDVTVNGSTGDATDKCNGDVIRCGMFIWAQWSGGDSNVIATVTITGEKEV